MSNRNRDEFEHMKAVFLSAVSHELRTPLAKIIAAASVLGDGYLGDGLNDDQRSYLEMIENSAGYLNGIVERLLSFNQWREGKVILLREPIALNEIVREAIEPFVELMHEKKLHLLLRLAEELPPVTIDRMVMLHAFSCLVSNAVSFTNEDGRILILTYADAEGQAFEVRDTGIGIPAEKQPYIFDSFYQAEDPLTRQVGGLGIGLAYTRYIVNAHGGQLGFESYEGRGSRFTIWLPTRVASPDQLSLPKVSA